MSRHSIVEPTGTLPTSWKLAEKEPAQANIPNSDAVGRVPEPAVTTRSKWELREVG